MTNITIPPEHIAANRRLNYSFLWEKSGEPSSLAKQHGFDTMDFEAILEIVFPYSVAPAFTIVEFSEGGSLYGETHEWLQYNVKGVWNLWMFANNFAQRPRIMFTDERDAVLFKLHWG